MGHPPSRLSRSPIRLNTPTNHPQTTNRRGGFRKNLRQTHQPPNETRPGSIHPKPTNRRGGFRENLRQTHQPPNETRPGSIHPKPTNRRGGFRETRPYQHQPLNQTRPVGGSFIPNPDRSQRLRFNRKIHSGNQTLFIKNDDDCVGGFLKEGIHQDDIFYRLHAFLLLKFPRLCLKLFGTLR